MVYKKYIKRGGKLFGPYYYRSVKKEGKVITQYVKNPEDFPQKKSLVNSKKNFTEFLIFSALFLTLILVFFLIKPVFTGKATFSVENAGISGETLSGDLKLNLESNEFIPASTKVLIENGEEKYEFILRELIKESPESREFYVSGAEISGFGEGYGIVQGDLEVSFTMKILSEPKKEKSDEIDEQEIQEENVSEITEQEIQQEEEITEENIESIGETLTESSEEIIGEISEVQETTETEITGATILNFFNNIFLTITGKTSLENTEKIIGKVSKDKPFIYPLEDGQTAEITESDKKVNLEIINNSVVVTTDYSGEGVEYLINLSELNIPVRDKSLEIKLIYNESEFYSLTKNLNIKNLNESNQIIQEINITDNSTIQYGAVLGEPVKWKKTITASEQNTIIELPAQAENISVYKIENQNVLLNSENLSSLTINEQKTGSFLTSSSSKEGSQTTGNLILEYSSDRKGFFSKIAKFITGRAIEITEKSEKIEVNISENGTEYEIEYTTPAPISFEKNTSSGKEVVISSEVHYENVLAYTSLPENTNLKEIKLYQIVDGLKSSVDFIAYNKNNEIIEESNDLDDDILGEIEKIVNKKDEIENKSLIYGEESGDKLDYSVKKIRANEKENLVSYIEWIVPSLSNQTYEIILISKAEHLDSNRNFISDIYESVKSLDGNWSERINDSEYIRITFEKNLTNENDITIYPRTINGTPRIEIYENNKTELIAEFTNIKDNEYNKVYLTNLNNSQNIFDLKILGGSVEFDYIVDPIILGNANSLNTNTTYENNFTHLNVSNSSIVAYYPFDDNVSATTVYDYTNNSNDGTLNINGSGSSALGTISGVYGGAYTFDGKDDYISASSTPNIDFEGTDTFSLSAWVKRNANGVQYIYIDKRDSVAPPNNKVNYVMFSDASNQFSFLIQSSTTNRLYVRNTASTLTTGKWYNLIVTYNGSRTASGVKMYIDGSSVAVTSVTDALTLTSKSGGSLGLGVLAVDGTKSGYLNGSIDEVSIWDTALNSTEVLALYNNQTARFHGTGEMNYTGVNFAGNDTINITLAGCQQNMGTSLRAKVNNGAYVNFDSSCSIKDYNATGNLNSANVTVGFVSDAYNFYTPLVIGNISLDSRDLIIPNITINFPANNSFSSKTNLSINFTAQSNDLSTCWYSNDTYTANTTLANCGNITTVQWTEGQHNVTVWVNDSANSVNSSMVSFTIDTTLPTWSANETNLTASTLNGKGVYFNITLTETNPNTYIFSWYNGTAWENTSASYTNNQEVSITKTINIDVATINWTWYINDSANNLNQTDIWSVTLLADDNVAPNISFANPTTNATNLSQNFIFANLSFADATSPISMANISLFNSTQNIINSTQGTISTLEINFTGLADGTYYLNASVNDTLGNRNQTETRKIILDATAPNLTINSPTSGTYETSTILFNATSLDATTLVDSCWYTINSGTTNRTLSKAGTANNYNFTQTSVSDNAYTARFYCNDSANNVNNTQNVAFSVSTAVPVGGGPAPAPAVAGGGGGGGAPSKPEKKRIFNLGYSMYDQTISLKQVEFDKLEITNNGEVAEEYTIEVKTIDNIISFEEKKIKLEPEESKAVEFKISSPKEPGIYTGKIIVSNGVSEREVLVTINVKTEKSLFDITLTIPESMKTILFGQNLISKIDLIQMGLKENIDVTLNYVIKDFEGQTYLSESETIAVLDEKSYEKEFFTGNIPAGQYVLGTELIHPDGVAVASTHFVVEEKGVKFGKGEILLSALILVLIVISLVIFLSIRKYKKIGKMLKANR